jgi:hypothetical protein
MHVSDSFLSWIRLQTGRGDPVGRLARDVVADPQAPDGSSKAVWLGHLALRNAGPGAIAAFENAWEEFGAQNGHVNKVMLTVRAPAPVALDEKLFGWSDTKRS